MPIIISKIFFNKIIRKDINPSRNRGMSSEHIGIISDSFSFMKGQSEILYKIPHPFKRQESGMTFIHMAYHRFNSEGMEGSYTTNTKDNFLMDSCFNISTIKGLSNFSIRL